MSTNETQHDLFISHASEDKETFVRPLAIALTNLGVSVWFDEFSLRVGDSLSRSIDRGLTNSLFGAVIISKAFIDKAWPEYELRGLVAREIAAGGQKIILPIWHGVTQDDVLAFSPPLADKVALNTQLLDAESIALQLLQVVRPDMYQASPRSELRRIASGVELQALRNEIEGTRLELERAREQLSDFQCPTCGAALEWKSVVPLNDPHDCDYLLERYECGYEASDGHMSRLCRNDPRFPSSEDYELAIDQRVDGHWTCFAKPMTYWARLIDIPVGTGATREEAEANLRRYLPRGHRSPSQPTVDPPTGA